MLPSSLRLTKKADFDHVWKQGQSFFLKELGVKKSSNTLPNSRFGFVVSTKVSKLAVTRNLIKRRLRAIIAENVEVILPGFDIVIFTRPGASKLNFDELRSLLESIFIKLKLLTSGQTEKNQ